MINKELLSSEIDIEIFNFIKEESQNQDFKIKMSIVCNQCGQAFRTVYNYKNHMAQCELKRKMQTMWSDGCSLGEIFKTCGILDRIPENAQEFTKDTVLKSLATGYLYGAQFSITEIQMTGYKTTLHSKRRHTCAHNYSNLLHVEKCEE